MASKINLFRLTLTTDTLTTGDRIDFNDPGATNPKSSKFENAYCTFIDRMSSDGVGDNQGAEQDLGDIQALGPVEDLYTLTGFISKRDGDLSNGQNQFLILLDLWDSEFKNSDNWPEGRFGIKDDGDVTNDLTPVRTGSNQIGLIWESYDKKADLAHNRVNFIIKLRVSRGDGT